MERVGAVLWPKLKVLQVYGANTGVGKTVVSAVLCRAFTRHPSKVNVYYVKPVSTGPLDEADDRHLTKFGNGVTSRCLLQFDEPISPHLSARSSNECISDSSILQKLHDGLCTYAQNHDGGIAVVETAGGVLSPAPSGSSQADLYRPLRIPVLLVGDHKLGGIGTTISAWESLHLRGYDVKSVSLFEERRYGNLAYLTDYFADRGVHVFGLALPPERSPKAEDDAKAMGAYYEYESETASVQNFVSDFVAGHNARIQALRSMPARTDKAIWHPFLQHTERSKDTIVAMDSAYGDYFDTYNTPPRSSYAEYQQRGGSQETWRPEIDTPGPEDELLRPAFDGSASWWTQGLGHGNPRLALTAAHAAGRYGHVMFAGAIHEPALTLAETIIQHMGNPRLSKVFYTDNGSTGMEVAVKMALKAASKRYGWKPEDDVLIMGFKGSYHGDTIGTMDCSEPSIYNKKVEWYQGRGHWLDFPTVKMRNGKWIVETPDELGKDLAGVREFRSLDEVFDYRKREGDRRRYEKYLQNDFEVLEAEGKKFGALIMEPIILGAGGMNFADPLFQRCLVDAVRHWQKVAFHNAPKANKIDPLSWSGMPVVFDEVFTGIYRLGRFSAASFLDVDPDIVVNAKLLTGGLLPLCTTTASESIFEAFLSNDKSDALLHGHSYTAHAVGCAVANESLSTMMKIEKSQEWDDYRQVWQPTNTLPTTAVGMNSTWSMWSPDFVSNLSHRENVDSVFALGSVVAISLKDPSDSGYSSTAATGLRDLMLRGNDNSRTLVHSRVLGNVLYLMAAMTTSRDTLREVEQIVVEAINT